MKFSSKSRELSVEEVNAFGEELDALRKETIASLGRRTLTIFILYVISFVIVR